MEIPRTGNVAIASAATQFLTDAPSVPAPSSSGANAGAAGPASKTAASPDQVRDAARRVQEAISTKAADLRFSLDDETDKVIVKMVDEKSQTVLLQIPSKEMLEIAKAIDKMQGLLVKQKA